jgi:hypothetical protein
MHTTRRNFLRVAGTAGMLATAGGFGSLFGQQRKAVDLFPLPAEVYSQPLFSMGSKQFEVLIGRTFTAVSESGRANRLVLTEVNRLERMQNTVGGYYGECYSLIFESSAKVRLTQDVYEIRAEGLESFSALVVPTGRRLREFEIIVNHLAR